MIKDWSNTAADSMPGQKTVPSATKEKELAWNEFDVSKVKDTWNKVIQNPIVKAAKFGLGLATGGIGSSAIDLADSAFNYGVDYASGNKRDLSKKDKKALQRFGRDFSDVGSTFGKAAKNAWDNYDWGEEGWGGKFDPLPIAKNLYKGYKNAKSTWNDYYMNLKNWIPSRKIETTLAPEYGGKEKTSSWGLPIGEGYSGAITGYAPYNYKYKKAYRQRKEYNAENERAQLKYWKGKRTKF